jgi:hypothetical protein
MAGGNYRSDGAPTANVAGGDSVGRPSDAATPDNHPAAAAGNAGYRAVSTGAQRPFPAQVISIYLSVCHKRVSGHLSPPICHAETENS